MPKGEAEGRYEKATVSPGTVSTAPSSRDRSRHPWLLARPLLTSVRLCARGEPSPSPDLTSHVEYEGSQM